MPLPASLALTGNAALVYFPVVLVDAPLIVGAFVSTIKEHDTFTFIFHMVYPAPLSLKWLSLMIYFPSDTVVDSDPVPFATSFPSEVVNVRVSLESVVLKFSFEDATYPPSCSVAVPDVDEPVRYRIISSVCPDVLYFCTEIFV